MDKRHYSFDLEFQKYLLASFLSSEVFLKDHYEIFRPEYFGDDVLQGIVEAVRDFFGAHGEAPGREALQEEIKNYVAPGVPLTSYIGVIDEVFDRIGVNSSYYQEKAVEFAKVHVTHNALKNAFVLVEQGKVEEAWKELGEAQKQTEAASRNGFYDYFKGIADRAVNYFKQREGISEDLRVPTGFPSLDDRIQGGLGQGETGIIVAPAKHGKTTVLISMAMQSLIREKKVLYVTLELSKQLIASKFDSYFMGATLDKLRKKPKSFQEEMEKIAQKIKGGLTIIEFPTKTLTLMQLQSSIEKESPHIVFLDYAVLLKTIGEDQDWREVSLLHEELRGVAGRCKVPIWTAHQSNRPGFGAKIVEMEHLARDINIAGIADVLISVNQSSDEKRRGTLRFYIMGNRLGSSGDTIACDVRWDISKITPAFGDKDEELK